MADNKVTIDADYFYELFRKANETDNICKECREEHTAEEFNALVKERDELKAKLAEHAELLQRTEAERVELKAKLESYPLPKPRLQAKVAEMEKKLAAEK